MVKTAPTSSLASGWALCALAFAALGAAASPLHAQTAEAESRPVVQPLPPAGVSDLNSALRRLASNTRDLGALIDAGNASLQLNDVDAAIGFFGRADELSPGNAQVKLGLAGAFVRSERPLEALRLFDEAERAGASNIMLAADRGLAYDLVGDPTSAQMHYRKALASRPTDEIIRRMAISQAIAGDRAGFEKTLYPLLEKRDLSGYRTRAFGLAILGDEAEAVKIAEAVMPAQLSARITPYLRYMKRLTTAQQAAAANLGAFPRAAQIGRDDPRIAQYTPPERPAAAADTPLAPQGEPLGPRPQTDTRSQRRRPDRSTSSVSNSSRKARAARNDPSRASDPLQRTQAPRVVSVQRPVEAPKQAVAAPAQLAPVASTPVTQQPDRVAANSSSSTLAAVVAQQSQPVAQPVNEPPRSLPPRGELPPTQVAQGGTPASPGFDLARVTSQPAVQAPVQAAVQAPVQAAPQQIAAQIVAAPAERAIEARPPASVADAFAGLAAVPTAPDISGAVDITSIKPPREKAQEPAPKPVPKPVPPRHPSRFWVQVATGKDLKALAFDWRKMGRNSPDNLAKQEAYVAQWGQTRRLLTGPYDTLKAAQAAVAALKKAGMDSFTFTSSEGEEVEKLK